MKIFVKKLKTMRINHKILNYIKKVDNKIMPLKKEINFNKEKKCINCVNAQKCKNLIHIK